MENTETGLVPAGLTELLRTMLEPDGYAARVLANEEGTRLRVEISAAPGACADCLVPKGMLALVLRRQLPDGVALEEGDLVYPGEPG
jgi:hypothetical protein